MRDLKVLPQILVALAANGGSFMYGMSLGWSAQSGPKLTSSDYKFEVTAANLNLAVTMLQFGAALSCVASGLMRNKFGCKFTIIFFTMPNILGWLLLLFASNSSMLILGRLFIGIAVGCYSFNIPVFVGEIASKEIRGILLTFYQVFITSGILFVYVLGYFVDLFTLHVICVTFLVCYALMFLMLPETPSFLIRKNQIEKAEAALKMLRGSGYNVKAEISELEEVCRKVTNEPKRSFLMELRNPASRKAFFIIFCMFFFFQASGNNPVVFFTTQIFIEAGITLDASFATIILGIVQIIMTLSTMFFIDRFGRRILLKISFAIMIVAHVSLAGFFILKDIESNWLQYLGWLPLVALSVYFIGFSTGAGSIPFILVGEVFSHEAKKAVAPVAQTMNFVASVVIVSVFLVVVQNLGAGVAFSFFGLFCFGGLLYTIYVLPETKGKSLAEIQEFLAN